MGIDPLVVRESDKGAVERAIAIARLYGLAPGSTPLVAHGTMPTQSRKGAPAWEKQARRRMHQLLQPKYGA
ncbi:hypothetical protein, partial [Streptomyces sp. NRRL S-15]|uniref:hypothetical protein n=1 Tax=Streptomyces sp. NRRL S-15 TaxID=1463886 RepID=UPI001F1D26C1